MGKGPLEKLLDVFIVRVVSPKYDVCERFKLLNIKKPTCSVPHPISRPHAESVVAFSHWVDKLPRRVQVHRFHFLCVQHV